MNSNVSSAMRVFSRGFEEARTLPTNTARSGVSAFLKITALFLAIFIPILAIYYARCLKGRVSGPLPRPPTVSTHLPPPAAAAHAPVVPEIQFSAADLVTFRAVLMKYRHDANHPLTVTLSEPFDEQAGIGEPSFPCVTYKVWYNTTFKTWNFQPENLFEWQMVACKLSMQIDLQGNIVSVYYANKSLTTEEGKRICSINAPKMEAIFHATLKSSSVYNKSLNPSIFIVNRGLRIIPEFHMRKYLELIQNMFQGAEPRALLRVGFLEDDLNVQAGIDATGLSRAYFDMLFQTLTDPHHIGPVKFVPVSTAGTHLVIPQSQRPYDVDQPDVFPELCDDERTCYEQMGQTMLFSYLTSTINIGRHFDRTLFHTILSLTPETMTIPFSQLLLKDRAVIFNSLLSEDTPPYLRNILRPLINGQGMDDAWIAACSPCLTNRLDLFAPFMTDDELDVTKIRNPTGTIKEEFREALLKELFTHQPAAIQQIAPLQAIARGMKSFCIQPQAGMTAPEYDTHQNRHWITTMQRISVQDFAQNIQGSLDRHAIINKMQLSQLNQPVMAQKYAWLQEWVLDPSTTEDELAGFLRFTTGSSSVGDQPIRIISEFHHHSPVPCAHTCFNQLVLSSTYVGNAILNDRTSAGFINALKYAIAHSGDNFLMGSAPPVK